MASAHFIALCSTSLMIVIVGMIFIIVRRWGLPAAAILALLQYAWIYRKSRKALVRQL